MSWCWVIQHFLRTSVEFYHTICWNQFVGGQLKQNFLDECINPEISPFPLYVPYVGPMRNRHISIVCSRLQVGIDQPPPSSWRVISNSSSPFLHQPKGPMVNQALSRPEREKRWHWTCAVPSSTWSKFLYSTQGWPRLMQALRCAFTWVSNLFCSYLRHVDRWLMQVSHNLVN